MLIGPPRRARFSISLVASALLACSVPSIALPAAQSAAPAAPTRLLGTVTATSANSLSLKLENGSEVRVEISPQTKLVRTAPGATTLAGATIIHVDDLASGDRVSVRLAPGSDPTHYAATAVITMKQADVAQAHASEAADWQRRGVGGIVKSIDPGSAGPPASGATIVVGTTQPARPLSIQVTSATIIRRYAADSINFADAKPSTLAEIHPGDQLRARGDRTADGSAVTAVEVVAGSFRNVAGTITAVDLAQNTLTVTDLATHKPLVLHLTADTQMRKLPPEMAQRLAARTGAGRPAGAGNSPQGSRTASPPTAGAANPEGESRPRADPAAMLQRAPAVTLAELKKGDAVMIVATRGGVSSEAATAITLIAGVEPLLQGSSDQASQNLFSASWNLSGGGGAEAAPQ